MTLADDVRVQRGAIEAARVGSDAVSRDGTTPLEFRDGRTPA